MTNSMGPPPPKNPNPPSETPIPQPPDPHSSQSTATATATAYSPEPQSTTTDSTEPQSAATDSAEPQSATTDSTETQPPPPFDSTTTDNGSSSRTPNASSQGVAVPYKIPPWSAAPGHEFHLEVLKDGAIIDKLNVCEKGAYMFGRLDLCDFVLEHPTISRFHAVIQFKRSGNAYVYDLGSTHGTFLNKNQVEKNKYVDLHVGDVIRFGRSSRLFILQGPSEFMPPETNKKLIREVKMREAKRDREASLQRARLEASRAEGVSWGMGEDAIEEDEDDVDEITWQTYKGQLTEKQEKTREKVIKRMEKIGNMKKEINAIRVKDISQGGLTQGQQTQIARNEQRIAQVMEELENLEETLNDSIRESLGARTGKISSGKKKDAGEDEEDFSDDDDEFYDRTKKKPSHQKPGENQSVETADTLLDKRDAMMKEINDKKELLMIEKNKLPSQGSTQDEVGDSLDAFMTSVSSQLVYDTSAQLEKELSALQSELDRISYLLKIADPTGEAAKKRELKLQEPRPIKSEGVTSTVKKPTAETQKSSEPSVKSVDKKPPVEAQKVGESCAKTDVQKPPVEALKVSESFVKGGDSMQGEKPAAAIEGSDNSQAGCVKLEAESVVFALPKPQWLGAVGDKVTDDALQLMAPPHLHETDEPDQFVDYKDRNKILGSSNDERTSVQSNIESAAPGLIIRKRKQVETAGTNSNDASQQSNLGEQLAENAVALLLKHQKGLYAEDDGDKDEGQKRRRSKKVLGPEKPSSLSDEMDNDTWVPPKGQSGDGRTSLNDKFGY